MAFLEPSAHTAKSLRSAPDAWLTRCQTHSQYRLRGGDGARCSLAPMRRLATLECRISAFVA
eukprot:6174883-Pleurochrysis_carterae.AAC.1